MKQLPSGEINFPMKKKQVGTDEAGQYGFSAKEGVKCTPMDMSETYTGVYTGKDPEGMSYGKKKNMSKPSM